MQYSLRAWAETDQGTKHETNEDGFLTEPELGLFAVCDGMGGKGLGTKASQIAMARLKERRLGNPLANAWPADGVGTPEQRKEVLGVIREALQDANAAVYQENQAKWVQRGMGTTATMLMVLGRTAFLGHVGHSRAYLIRGGKIHRLTEDHTILAEIRKRKHNFDEETLKRLPYRNSLTRTLGPNPTVDPDVLEFELYPGDRFLLCSDGLHAHFDEVPERLADLVQHGSVQDAPVRLIGAARKKGGADDVTAVVVDAFPEDQGAQAEARDLSARFLHGMDGLRQVRLFQYLDDAELMRLVSIAEDCVFAAGQPIVTEGELGDTMFLLLKGKVSVMVGANQVSVLGEGSIFGEMALVTQQPRTASVVAETEVHTKMLRQKPLYSVMREHPTLGNKVLWNIVHVLSSRLDERTRDLAAIKKG